MSAEREHTWEYETTMSNAPPDFKCAPGTISVVIGRCTSSWEMMGVSTGHYSIPAWHWKRRIGT